MEYPELYAFLNEFHSIPASLFTQSDVKIERRVLRKGESLLEPGESSGKAGFVLKGLCRQYYLSESGKEHTKYFQMPGSVAIAFAEMIRSVPSRCYIQAVVDTELYIMTHPNFSSLFDKNLDTQVLARRIAERYFIEKDQREYEFLHFSALKRYHAFQEKYRDVEHLIPMYQVASYIGVTPVALSRLINR